MSVHHTVRKRCDAVQKDVPFINMCRRFAFRDFTLIEILQINQTESMILSDYFGQYLKHKQTFTGKK